MRVLVAMGVVVRVHVCVVGLSLFPLDVELGGGHAGALDVYYTAVQMKKNRPGTLLTVIAPPAARGRLTGLLFRETTTIGVRYREMSRECLDRETVTVRTPWGPVRIKVARRDGQVLNAAPEFDDCVRVATDSGRPVKEVHAAAMAQWAVDSSSRQ